MVLDYNKIKEGSDEGVLTVSEQLPGLFISKDQVWSNLVHFGITSAVS